MPHWIIAYHRDSDRFADGMFVPVELQPQALFAANITDLSPGEVPLSCEQIIALAGVMDFRFDFGLYRYCFEVLPA